MNVPIRAPYIFQESTSGVPVQKAPLSDGSNTFPASSLVKVASGVLAIVATAGVLCYGLTPDASHASTEIPPQAFFGENHYVFDVKDRILAINAATVTGSPAAAVVGDTGQTWAGGSMAVGQTYGIFTDANGQQYLNLSDTSTTLFTVVGLHPSMSTTDKNPLILVKVIDAKIQD